MLLGDSELKPSSGIGHNPRPRFLAVRMPGMHLGARIRDRSSNEPAPGDQIQENSESANPGIGVKYDADQCSETRRIIVVRIHHYPHRR